MQPPNKEFFTLFSETRSDIVERVAIRLAALASEPPGRNLCLWASVPLRDRDDLLHFERKFSRPLQLFGRGRGTKNRSPNSVLAAAVLQMSWGGDRGFHLVYGSLYCPENLRCRPPDWPGLRSVS
jgi:hypothetical protein